MEHGEMMRDLLGMRENRAQKLEIARLGVEQVVGELKAWGCSTDGDLNELKDRLLRARLRANINLENFVPWYDWDEAVAPEDVENVDDPSMVGASNERDGAEGTGRWSRDGEFDDQQEASRGANRRESVSASSRTESLAEQGTRTVVEALVHEKPLIVVSSTVASTSTTVTTVTKTRTTPSVVTSVLGNPYTTGANQPLGGPKWQFPAVNADLWEYYSAERIRALRPARLPPQDQIFRQAPMGHERLPARRETVQIKASSAPSQLWYTAKEDLDAIHRLPSSRSSLAGSEYAKLPDDSARIGPRFHSTAEPKARVSESASYNRREQQQQNRQRLRRSLVRDAVLSDTGSEAGGYASWPVEETPKRSVLPGGATIPRAKQVERSLAPRKQHRKELEVNDVYSDSSAWSGRQRRGQTHAPKSSRKDQLTSSSESSDSSGGELPRRQLTSKSERRDAGRKERGEALNRPSSTPQHGAEKALAVKLLKSWCVKFSGEDRNEDAEEFLEQLDDCCEGAQVKDAAILSALPCVLSKRAARWYRTERSGFTDWNDFRSRFRSQFVSEYDREDLLDDLRKRTQAKGEKISGYLASLRYIVSRFAKPPSERRLTEIAWRNLLPEYRRAMMEKVVDSLRDMEEYGRRWERQRDLDSRYVPPPPAEKMHVPGAAFGAAQIRGKVAELQVTESASAVTSTVPQAKARGGKKKRGGRSSETSAASATSQGASRDQAAAIISSERSSASHPSTQEEKLFVEAVQSAPTGTWPKPVTGQQRGTAWGPAGGVQARPAAAGVPPPRSPAGSRPANGGAAAAPFFGACFTCQSVGHRASQCPERVCFSCKGKGHNMNVCPVRCAQEPGRGPPVAAIACQNCGTAGVTLKMCPHCVALCLRLGNGRPGEQKS